MLKTSVLVLLSISGCLAFGQQSANLGTLTLSAPAKPTLPQILQPDYTSPTTLAVSSPDLNPLSSIPDLNFSRFSDDYLEENFKNFKGTASLGPGVSGGENAVVCFDDARIPTEIRNPKSTRYGQIGDDEIKNHVTSIIAYDLYIAQMRRGLNQEAAPLIEPKANENVRDYLERIAHRFDGYIPAVSELIRHGSKAFKDSNIISRPSGLARIHDENDVGYIDPNSCVVATMAAQYKEGGEDFLQLDDRLFSHPKHSKLSRYVLLLHEMIYNSVRTYTHQTDSLSTRTLVGQILNANPLDQADLRQQYVSLGMPVWPSLITAPSALYHQEITDIRIDLDRAMQRIAGGLENKKLVDDYNALIKKFWPAGSYNSKAAHLNRDQTYPYAATLRVDVNNCQAKKDIASGACGKAWTEFGVRWENFSERAAVTISDALMTSLKTHLLNPLAQIPGADSGVVQQLGLDLWAAIRDSSDDFGRTVEKIGDGPGFVQVDMTSDFIEEDVQNAQITTVIP